MLCWGCDMAEQPPALITQHIRGREDGDCAIAAVATYLNQTYEDVLRVVSEVDKKNKGKKGLFPAQLKKVCAGFGVNLKKRTGVNLQEDYGLLWMPGHIAVIRNGLLFDADGSIWDVEDYLNYHEVEGVSLYYA